MSSFYLCDFCEEDWEAVALYAALNGDIFFLCEKCLVIVKRNGFHYRLLKQCKTGGESD